MPIEILMPALSPTMTEGNLAKWLKQEGDAVKPGDVIAEIETDKATMEVEAVDEGTVGKIMVPAGSQGVKVNQVIALLLGEGEDATALAKAGAAAAKAAPAPAPAAAPAPAVAQAPAAQAPTAPAPVAPQASAAKGDRVFASPLARRMAQQAGLDIARLNGSGPHGRIVKSDIEAAVARGVPTAAPAAAPAAAKPAPAAPIAPVPGMPAYTEVPHSMMRKVIARRLVESKREAPHFYLTIDCNIDALLKLRQDINAKREKDKISVNDLVIKACALALKPGPGAHASVTDTAARLYQGADISVAVATPGGLITPIIRSADTKSIGTISGEMKDLAGRARENKLKPEEFQGGTF